MPIKTSTLDEMPALNLTAMIDVLFLLIIFFMLGTKFIEDERRIAVETPRVGANRGLAAPSDKKIVSIDRGGIISLDGQTVSLAELTTRLATVREKNKRLGVLVRGDANAAFQLVAGVLSACKEAGVSDVGVSVRIANATKRSN
jgi:biopolymer transport protein ExbD